MSGAVVVVVVEKPPSPHSLSGESPLHVEMCRNAGAAPAERGGGLDRCLSPCRQGEYRHVAAPSLQALGRTQGSGAGWLWAAGALRPQSPCLQSGLVVGKGTGGVGSLRAGLRRRPALCIGPCRQSSLPGTGCVPSLSPASQHGERVEGFALSPQEVVRCPRGERSWRYNRGETEAQGLAPLYPGLSPA